MQQQELVILCCCNAKASTLGLGAPPSICQSAVESTTYQVAVGALALWLCIAQQCQSTNTHFTCHTIHNTQSVDRLILATSPMLWGLYFTTRCCVLLLTLLSHSLQHQHKSCPVTLQPPNIRVPGLSPCAACTLQHHNSTPSDLPLKLSCETLFDVRLTLQYAINIMCPIL